MTQKKRVGHHFIASNMYTKKWAKKESIYVGVVRTTRKKWLQCELNQLDSHQR
ncbi:uncharacterized protein DS421_1g20860 [Arachis hypogaea]|nr:uncharacterized protein DS421_1g20860 [Arachis hypogaea]